MGRPTWPPYAVAVLLSCGPTPYIAVGERAQGLTACGGSLSLLGDWEKEVAGELIATGPVASIARIGSGVRIGLGDGRSFVIGLDAALEPPVAVGDRIDVSIRCQPVGWNTLGCHGTVLSATGALLASNTMPPASAGWTIERGPLVERRTHSNYGPTSIYGLTFAVGGATAISPRRGCAELRTTNGTFRVLGTEVEHGDPRAPDSADTFDFDIIRVP